MNQPNNIQPDPNCKKCRGTGYIFKHGENKKCKCIRKKEKEMGKYMNQQEKKMRKEHKKRKGSSSGSSSDSS